MPIPTSPPSHPLSFDFPFDFDSDPALHLHSECDNPHVPPSDSYSSDIEALTLQREDNTRKKVVIQHRAWNLSDVFRSDEDIRPDTPTRTRTRTTISKEIRYGGSPGENIGIWPSSPPTGRMTMASVGLPEGEVQKRKNEEEVQAEPKRQKMMGGFLDEPDDDEWDAFEDAQSEKKKSGEVQPEPTQKQKILGGFVDEPDDDEWDAFENAQGQIESQTEPKRQKIMGGFLDEADDDEWNAFEDAQLRSDFQVQEEIIQRAPVDLPEIPRLRTVEPDLTPKASEPYLDPTPTTIVPFIPSRGPFRSIPIKTCSGKTHYVPLKKAATRVTYERLVAGRSATAPGRAQKSYYGIDIHKLLDEAAKEAETPPTTRPAPVQSIEAPVDDRKAKLAAAMWTEKYRARKFTELIGDERTHRSVLRWLKAWEPIVFPNIARSKPKKPFGKEDEERTHRKVLLLCGPPGLGKTTVAHVCARQAGYEVLEINASDDRSRDVVKGRIRDALATENVKGMNVEVGEEKVRKAGRPVCVVVDEVDGVTSGSGGSGEGGFMKALIDLVMLDQKNSAASSENKGKKKKGDNFRFLRPLIMVCNDVYHPSLRPLRAASVAEIIHVRQAPLENVVSRMKRIFTVEGIPSDNDGVRRLCEASWGLARRKQGGVKSSGTAEGDIRSVLVAAEWVAHKLRNECPSTLRLTRSWLEQKVLSANTGGSSFFKGLNRGGVRDLVERVFTEGAGFADAPVGVDSFRDPFGNSDEKVPVGVADLRKRHAIDRLREMVDASGEHDRCVAECFASYPLQTFQDDTFLSKPNAAYEWLHFHDTMSSKVYTAQDWELSAYLSQSVVAFHHLFASAQGKAKAQDPVDDDEEEHPFSGPRADFAAYEAQKQNRAILTEFQSAFSAPLSRLFRSTDSLVIDLIPNLIRMLSPDVKPVVVRGSGEQRSVASVRKESERALVQSAVRVMAGLGVRFEKVRIENAGAHNGWAYRMEPPLDTLITFSKINPTSTASAAPVRYAVRQVLDQEYRKENIRKHSHTEPLSKTSSKKSSQKTADDPTGMKKTLRDGPNVKRDFFGRIIKEPTPQPDENGESLEIAAQNESLKAGRRVWVTYHDGFSNAVRKPISLAELLAEL